MEMCTAIPPAVEVDAGDVAEPQDGTLDPGGDRAEVSGYLGGQIREGIRMHAAGQPDRPGQAAADGRMQRPVLVGPDRSRARAGTDAARLSARLTASRWLGHDTLVRGANHERLAVGQGHGAHSFVRGAISHSRSLMRIALARSGGQSCRPRKWV